MKQHIIEKIYKYRYSVNSATELAKKCNVSRMTIMKYCKILNVKIDYKIKYGNRLKNKYDLKDILDGQYPQYPTSKISKRLISEGIKEYKCEECNLSEWRGKDISLHLDHIDGNNTNHKLENLRLLCPNCHSQTKTFGAKNIETFKRKSQSNVTRL